jgi:hypothetical protein
MKTTLLSVAIALTMALMVMNARVQGAEATMTAGGPGIQHSGVREPEAGADGWRYCWHDSRWWYWTPEKHWLVWTGASWVPFESSHGDTVRTPGGSASSRMAGYGSDQRRNNSASSSSTYRGARSWANYGVRTSDYAGHGWTWGPGTAYRNGPGPRF